MKVAARHAVAASHVFDGEVVHRDAAVVIDGSDIVRIAPRSELPSAIEVHRLPEGAWLAPGFIDLQVNGGGDVLFNDQPSPGGIRAIAAAHRRFGTTALLPTLISDTREKMEAALAGLAAVVDAEPSVLGIHLEGPFISPERPGVHDLGVIRAPTPDDLALLTAPRRGALLVTLAPEQVPAGFIAALAQAGVRASLGHSNATYAQTRAALAEGLTGFTHLFNAMRPLLSREPGPIAAALESSASFGMIVDGVHVDPVMLRLALRGSARPILVTDAMPSVGGKRPGFRLYGAEITVRDGRCTRADGTLAGAFLDMASAVRNCVNLLHVPLPQALRLAARHPAEFIGAGDRLGRLAPGYRADLVAFWPEDVRVLGTWVAGSAEGNASSVGWVEPS
jgi:N-acetylglucosamine-6-phosphate deacetylase